MLSSEIIQFIIDRVEQSARFHQFSAGCLNLV